MKARDVMTTEVVTVRADTPVREIAQLLLENHISGLPVLDETGAPIGMVSDGDLGRRDGAVPQRQARQDWWLDLMASDEAGAAEILSALPGLRERTASQVMSAPVISVSEDSDLAEIKHLLDSYHIKRAPVVRDGKAVGIVSRQDLLRGVAEPKPPAPAARAKSWLLPPGLTALLERPHDHDAAPDDGSAHAPDDDPASVAEFRNLVTDFEKHEVQQREALRRSSADEHRRLTTELSKQHVSDDAWSKLVHKAREAAERGEQEFLLLRFPADLCSDGGRAVNAPEPDWPATLRGEAAEIYLRWEQDLKPRGFHIAARVVDFPGGMPGDVGLFLVWRE